MWASPGALAILVCVDADQHVKEEDEAGGCGG